MTCRYRCTICIIVSLLLIIPFSPLAASAPAEEAAGPLEHLFNQGWDLESRMHKDLSYLDKAIEIHEKALALAPDSEKAHWRLAEVIFKRSEEEADKNKRKAMLAQSIALAEQALSLHPESISGLYWSGVARARLADMSGPLAGLKQIRSSRTNLHKAIRIDPDHRLSILAKVVLALIYSQSPWPIKDMDQALELARRAVEQDSNLTIAALSLGKIYLAQGKRDAAREELRRCLAIEAPTYIWDAVLYDRPEAEQILAGLDS